MTRITRPQLFMGIARLVAQRSTCSRLNVGAVVVSDQNKIISIGYNGAPPGQPHCQGNECPGREGCSIAIHAEINALSYIPTGSRPKTLYVTHSPCEVCVRAILTSPLTTTIFETPYRKMDNLYLLDNLYQLTPAGYLIDWRTQQIVDHVRS